MLGSSVSFEILGPGLCEHIKPRGRLLLKKREEKNGCCVFRPWVEVPAQSACNFLTPPQPKTVLFSKDVIEFGLLVKLREPNTKEILSQT